MSNLPSVVDLHCNHNLAIPTLAKGIFAEIGEDPKREGLLKTPERFHKAIQDLTSGYALTPEGVVGEGIFESESKSIVCVKNIEFYSLCEHHMLPFWGKASIAYLPQEKILGLSKLARVLDVFARRLQVQERLTKEVAEAIYKIVDAKAVAVLAALPPKIELLAKLVGTLKSPLYGLVTVLSGNQSGLVRVLNSIREQKEAAGSAT